MVRGRRQPVVNAKPWKALTKEISKIGMPVYVQWFKGHSAQNPHNKTADKPPAARRSAAPKAMPTGHEQRRTPARKRATAQARAATRRKQAARAGR